MTLEDYKKHVENDPALDRRFQKVIIEPPSKEKMFDIMMTTKHHYEDFHGVIFGTEEVKLLIDMCDRYITYRHFPDKAIDVMDEVGSFTKMKSIEVPDECKEMEEELKSILAEKMIFASQQRYEDAALMRDKQRELQLKIDKRYEEWKSELDKNRIHVKFNDIRAIISKHSGIDITKLTQDEKEKLKMVESHLRTKVIGQDNAVKKVAQAIKRNKMDIHDPNKPFVFLFLGKTGTGKTLLAKALAKYLFDNDSSFIRLDMSEYMEKFSTARLIGSPAGFVGYDEKGGLTQKVKNNPYSLILLDEIEKSHPDVMNMFLQVFDDGILTDSHGMTVNFKNCVIIMTSNIGTSDLVQSNIGFNIGGDIDQETEAKVFKELKKVLKPEILNRIDEKILFTSINKEDAEKIIEIEVDALAQRLKKKGITMVLKQSMTTHLVENGFDPEYGARPLKRLITSVIENEVAQQMLDEKIISGDTFRVGYDGKKKSIIIDVDHRK
jgi:ATP-dependent Clp protease ATP-binding subunit ClpC